MPFDAAKLAKLQAQAAQSRIGACRARRHSQRHRRHDLLSFLLPVIRTPCLLALPFLHILRHFSPSPVQPIFYEFVWKNTLCDMPVLDLFARHTIVMVYYPPSGQCCTGGKGTVRRKVVKTTKASGGQDDRKLQAALKKLNMQPISGVEELNMFREDGSVLHFSAPKGE